MPASFATQSAVIEAMNYLKRALLSGGAASIADARVKLSAALAAYDA
jgi:hypothetical protein